MYSAQAPLAVLVASIPPPAYVGMPGYARKYGLVFFAYGLGAILGGILSGLAKDLLGGYRAVSTAALAVLGAAVAAAFLKPSAD